MALVPGEGRWNLIDLDRPLALIELSREGAEIAGTTPVAAFPRLCEEQSGVEALASNQVQWRLQGLPSYRLADREVAAVKLVITASLTVACQRCGDGCQVDLASDRLLVLANDEAQADDLSLNSPDDVDAVVGTDRFDLKALIEDEVLLASPLAPKHEACELGGFNAVQVSERDEMDSVAIAPNRPTVKSLAGLAAFKEKLRGGSESQS